MATSSFVEKEVVKNITPEVIFNEFFDQHLLYNATKGDHGSVTEKGSCFELHIGDNKVLVTTLSADKPRQIIWEWQGSDWEEHAPPSKVTITIKQIVSRIFGPTDNIEIIWDHRGIPKNKLVQTKDIKHKFIRLMESFINIRKTLESDYFV